MTERNTGIELLRIVSMFLIVLLHVLGQGGVLWWEPNFSAGYYCVWFLEAIAYCSVNCFALISGYVGIAQAMKSKDSSVRVRKVITLWFQVLFYGVVILGIFTTISGEPLTIANIKKVLMPITQSEYWYVTAYVGLFFIMPILNAAIMNMRRRQLFGCLLAAYVLLSGLPSLFYLDPFFANYGYSVLWLALLYLTGGYICRYDVAKSFGKKKALLLFIVCTLITWAGKTGAETLSMKVLGQIKAGYLFISYTTPFVVLAAIGLLMTFANIEIKKDGARKVIGSVAKTTLGVYIIHVSPFIFNNYIYRMTIDLIYVPVWKMLLMVVVYQLIIYLSCTGVEYVRIGIFRLLRIDKLSAWIERVTRKVFDKIAKDI